MKKSIITWIVCGAFFGLICESFAQNNNTFEVTLHFDNPLNYEGNLIIETTQNKTSQNKTNKLPSPQKLKSEPTTYRFTLAQGGPYSVKIEDKTKNKTYTCRGKFNVNSNKHIIINFSRDTNSDDINDKNACALFCADTHGLCTAPSPSIIKVE